MNKGQFILGKKVVAILLILVVLFTSMPVNVVYGVSDALSSEPETNTAAENAVENGESQGENTITDNSIINDAPNEESSSGENVPVITESETPVDDEPKLENTANQDDAQNNTEVEESTESSTENQLENQVNDEKQENSSENNVVADNDAENQNNLLTETGEQDVVKEDEINDNEDEIDNTESQENAEDLNKENDNNLTENEENLDSKEVDVNDIVVNKINLSGNITWKDNSNAYGTRPLSIKIGLLRNDETEVIKEIEVLPDELGNWNYNFEELDKQDANGNEIKYKITTNGLSGYNIVIDEANNMTNTLVGVTEISGVKTWKDNSNLYGTRPSSVTINLLKNSGVVIVSSIQVVADEFGNWNYKFENLEKYDENGVLIDYSVTENEIPGYETILEGLNSVSKVVGTTTLTGNISWNDAENNTRPELIYINVIKNGDELSAETYAITADEDGTWNYSFENLEKYDENGIEISYSISVTDIENYKSTVEKLSQTEFNISNVFVEAIEMNLTWQEILAYGPYVSMNVQYADEYGLEISQEEMYIYEQYQELIYVKGPALAAIAMFEGTDGFTEEEIAVYNAYQEIVLNGGEKSPISTLAEMGDTGNAIKNNGTSVLEYLVCYGDPVSNSIKYVAPVGRNTPQKGDRVAYCVNYDRSYSNSATYEGTSWDEIVDKYEPVYLRLYSELSYLVSIGCKEYGSHNNSGYSTGGSWTEDYYATQTVIYNVIYDYTGDADEIADGDYSSLNKLKAILKEIKAQDKENKYGIQTTDAYAKKVAAKIRETFTGHPGGSETKINPAYSRSQQVKDTVASLYNAVKNYRDNVYSLDNADGYAASITITDVSKFEFVQKSNGDSYYEVIVTVGTTGKLNSQVRVTCTGTGFSSTGTQIGSSNQYKIRIPKDKIGDKKNFKFTAKADFDMSRTITYISEVDGTQNVAFYQTNVNQDGIKTVTNTKKGPNTVSINGAKTWKDNNNAYNTRPSSITIKLYATNINTGVKKKVETQTITAADSWKWSFVGYPKYDNDGAEIKYTITENDIEKYSESVSGYNATNTLSEKTQFSITKQWKDNSNKYNTRPTEITVNLLRNGSILKTQKITSANSTGTNTWSYTFGELDKYDSNGKLYTYAVSEGEVNCNKPEIGSYKSEVNGTTIINTLVGKTELEGNKTWKDNNNAYGTRPDSIIVELLENGKYNGNYIEVKEDDDKEWKFLFRDLAKYDSDGVEIKYTIKENPSIGENYESKVNGNNLINTLVGKVKVGVKKAWNDDNNHHDTRPEYITVNLLADGVQVDSHNLTEADNWSYTFEDLDKYTKEGVKIVYTITESGIAEVPAGRYVTTITEGAESTEDDKQYELTNCLTDEIDIKGAKIWKDNNNEYGTRPESITVNLYRANKNNAKALVDSIVITADNEGNWKYEFTGLAKYDTKGIKYDYTVEENVIEEHEEGHYVDTYNKVSETHTEIVIDITNRLTGVTELGGDKTWKDNNNAYGTRPDSIIVNLLANGEKVQDKEVTSGENGDWKFFFTNLVKFDDEGKKIEYTISENDIINYVGKVEETNLTNTLTGKTEVTGVKIWHDSDNDYQTRPESIIVKLLANGTEISEKTVKADENGDWKFAFEDLEEYDEEGVKIVYTIDEVPVDRYVTDIKGTTLINTLIHNNIDIHQNTVTLDTTPKTGKKNLLTFFSFTALVSLVGLFILNRKDEKEF